MRRSQVRYLGASSQETVSTEEMLAENAAAACMQHPEK